VLEVCSKSHEGDPELSNEGEYLRRQAAIIANSADRCTNVDNTDIAGWLGKGRSVRLKAVTLPGNFRDTPRPPMEVYFDEIASWLGRHSPGDRCLIFCPFCEADGTSLVGLGCALLDHADASLDAGRNILALQHDGFHRTIELLALSQPS